MVSPVLLYNGNMEIGYPIPENHLIEVCRYRQREKCCKYIVWSIEKKGFYCGKLVEKTKKNIDEFSHSMIAKSDNCPGLAGELCVVQDQ